MKWEEWKGEVVKEAVKQLPKAPPYLLKQMMEDVEATGAGTRVVNAVAKQTMWSAAVKSKGSKQDAPVPSPRPSGIPNLLEWNEACAKLGIRLRRGEKWESEENRRAFEELGLIEWWNEIAGVKKEGGRIEWPKWKESIMEKWTRRHPKIFPTMFRWMVEDLEKLDIETAAPEERTGKTIQEDIEMADIPRTPNPTPNPSPKIPSSTQNAPDDHPTNEVTFDVDEINLIKGQILELEARMRETAEGMRNKVNELTEQIIDDGVILAQLKWKTNSALSMGGVKTKKRERNRRGQGKGNRDVPTHRYPTRYSEAFYDITCQPRPKDTGDAEGKIEKLANWIDSAKEEIDRLKSELTKTEALQSRVTALAGQFETFRTAQVKINVKMMLEHARLRNQLSQSFEPRLAANEQDVANLSARYNLLFAVAANILGPQAVGQALANLKATPPPYLAPIPFPKIVKPVNVDAPPFAMSPISAM
jgi:hypothetical protein